MAVIEIYLSYEALVTLSAEKVPDPWCRTRVRPYTKIV